MKSSTPRRLPSLQRVRIVAVVALALVLTPTLRAQSATDGDKRGRLLPIKNGRLVAAKADQVQPIEDWTFETLRLERISDEAARLRVEAQGEANVRVASDGQGVLLEGATATARGDLISAPLKLEPLRWIKVGVEYVVESGEPLVFVCLRPTKDRSLVDIEFLPTAPVGQKRRAVAELHSGLEDGDYSLSLSIVGTGSVRFLLVRGKEAGDYGRPKKPALVIDFLHDQPVTDGDYGWEDIQKLVKLFGFPAVEFLHYTETTTERIRAIDPALVVLSPLGAHSQNLDRRKVIEATRTASAHGGPLLGICLGHQLLALSMSDVGMDRSPEWGPTRIEAACQDPIFERLPRYPYMVVSESHNGVVRNSFEGVEIIATSDAVRTQFFRYTGKPWYTFQGHIERGWELACPEAHILWENLLAEWDLGPDVKPVKSVVID